MTCPDGFTVMVKLLVDPVHDLPPLVNVGVTTIVAVMGAVVVFVAEKDILPVPLAANPMFVVLFVQA